MGQCLSATKPIIEEELLVIVKTKILPEIVDIIDKKIDDAIAIPTEQSKSDTL